MMTAHCERLLSGAHIPYVTTIVAAKASMEGIHRMITHGRSPVLSLQEWQHSITDE